MKIEKTLVSKLRITDIENRNLDPITVIVENFQTPTGSGKIIIECYGESWAHYWSHMGKGHTIETFFNQASDDYIAGKLIRGKTDEPDWDNYPKHVRKAIITARRCRDITGKVAREYYEEVSGIDCDLNAAFYNDILVDIMGDDWMRHIPDRPTREFNYLMKIIPAVRDAFNYKEDSNANQ